MENKSVLTEDDVNVYQNPQPKEHTPHNPAELRNTVCQRLRGSAGRKFQRYPCRVEALVSSAWRTKPQKEERAFTISCLGAWFD